ncbi:MAG TPA: hypothetical protein ENF70_05840 [Deltaproteobacteria bacterium]|nr:hypothetical protein [Deltaproteobacteria bacterium]
MVNFASVGSGRLQGEGSYSIRIEPVEVVGTNAILALQVVSGMKPQGICPDYPLSGTDVNGDDRIGIEEAIYIMQKVSRLR